MRSILVQSGIYDEADRSKLQGDSVPTYEVPDMFEAVRLIIREENLKE